MQYPTRVLLKDNASINDLIKIVNQISIESINDPLVLEFNESISKSNNIPYEIYKKVYNNISYYPDLTNDQNIRTPNKTIRDKKANCIDYTTLISSLLFINNIQHSYKLVASAPAGEIDHIYIMVGNIPIDPVIGQPQNGTAEYNREPAINYGKQIKNYSSFTFKAKEMKVYKVNGFTRLTDITEQGQPNATNEFGNQNIFEIAINARPGTFGIARPGAPQQLYLNSRPNANFMPFGELLRNGLSTPFNKNLLLPIAATGLIIYNF